jgi:beta-galactosidase
LIYDVRPPVIDEQDDKPADAQPTEAEHLEMARNALKPWVLPSGNDFIKDPAKRHTRRKGTRGAISRSSRRASTTAAGRP